MKNRQNSYAKQNKVKVLNLSKLFCTAAMMLLTIASCQKITTPHENVTTLTFEAILNNNPTKGDQNLQQTSTRVTETAFAAGDKISVMAVKYNADGTPNTLGTDETITYINEVYDHVGGYFQPHTTTKAKTRLYPSDGTNIDLYGIYYGAQTVDPEAVVKFPHPYAAMPFEVKDVQTAVNWYESDLMMAKTVNCRQQITPNRLLFYHLMAKMVIRVKLIGYAEGVAVSTVKIVKMPIKATLNIGAFNAGAVPIILGSGVGTVTAQAVAVEEGSSYGYKAQAIVVPQTIARGTEFIEITLNTANKDTYLLSFEDAQLIEQGKTSTFNIEIKAGDRQHIKTTASITDWGEDSFDNTTLAKHSEYRFKIKGTPRTPTDWATVKSVKVRANGNRTFTLTRVKYNAAIGDVPPLIDFEFDGEGNRPSGGSFTMNRVDLINASGGVVDSGEVADIVFDESTTTTNNLLFNTTNNTITKE